MSEMGSLVTTTMHEMISTHFTHFNDSEGLRRDVGGASGGIGGPPEEFEGIVNNPFYICLLLICFIRLVTD